GRSEPRQKLCSLFWKDARREQAQQSLRQTLFSIRKALPAGADALLVANTRSVSIPANWVRVDALDLRKKSQEASRRSLERIAELYVGPLLDGLTLDEAQFDEWL